MIQKLILLFFAVFLISCSTNNALVRSEPQAKILDDFVQRQSKKIVQGEVYDDSLLIFKTSAYRPTLEDIETLKQTWFTYANSFPQSYSFRDIEEALTKDKDTVPVIITLYMTEYENADLRSKMLGWAVGPVPKSIKELDSNDVPVRKLHPSSNYWDRYFLVKFDRNADLSKITISNGSAKVELSLSSTQ